jgi:hypothetical protein
MNTATLFRGLYRTGCFSILFVVALTQSVEVWGQTRKIDSPEIAVAFTPGFMFYSGSYAHPLTVEFPALTLIYQRIMFSAIPSYGLGKATKAMTYNARAFIEKGGKFNQQQIEVQLGYAFKQQVGTIIPYFGLSGMRLAHKAPSGEEKILHLLPNYDIGVMGIYDLDQRFHMRTVIRDQLALRHFVRLNLHYTVVDASTTEQRKTNLPGGMFGIGIGWGVFISEVDR